MDQDCFNAVFNMSIAYLSCKYNYMSVNQLHYTEKEVADFYEIPQSVMPMFNLYANIIHLTNKQKPWDYKDVYGSELWVYIV